MNYLSVCDRSSAASSEAARTAKALRDIIDGRRAEYRMEYPCESPDGLRWFQLRVSRPSGARSRRIVVAHEDITEVKGAQQDLARLSSRLMQVQDDERRALARELHDTTAQNLLAIGLNLARLREPVAAVGEPVLRVLAETLDLSEQCLQQVRTLSYLLHPPLLDEMGLPSALRWFAKGFAERSNLDVRVHLVEASDVRLPREIATTLFRVAQEALSNVHRHSGSATAMITLHRRDEVVQLEIADRGRGLRTPIDTRHDVQAIGVGISGMRVRLEQLGGWLQIASGASGTCVIANVPLPRVSEEAPLSANDPLPTGAA
jgi:two-component system NarL family sensor kinase